MQFTPTQPAGADDGAIAGLAGSLAGTLHRPGEEAFDEACRIWNAMIAHRPAFTVRPDGAGDVAAAIRFARDHGLPLAVRGGGHNVAGAALSPGGVTIDMTQRRAVTVDPATRTVTVEAGANWGEVDAVTQAHGLIVPNGIVSNTGVAGLTLGGGFGWTSRKFGFTADNLLSVEMVTAEGQTVTASESENPELFWAMRGAGASLGVVTRFTFRAHPHGPEAMCGMIVHPFDHARDVMQLFREVTESAPDELTCLLVLRRAPPAPFLPESVHGQPIAAIAAHWTGPVAEGEAAMQRIKQSGSPLADVIAPKPFTAFQQMLDGGQPFGRRYYWKSDEASELSDGLMDVLADRATRLASPHSAILMMHMGGTPRRVAADATAVGIRDARYVIVPQSAWEDPEEDELHLGWARDTFAALKPYSSGASYINFLTADEDEASLAATFGAARYERLKALKHRFDPDNILRGGSLNVRPE